MRSAPATIVIPGPESAPAPAAVTAVTAALRPTPSPRPGSRRETRRRWLAAAFAAAGVGLIPWMVILARSLPSSARASHWAAAWVGLDALEALGLITTGLLLIRRDSRYCLTAAATAVLLLADAWLDVATAPPGREQLAAAGLALFAELPAAAVCGVLAISGSRRLAGRPRPGIPWPPAGQLRHSVVQDADSQRAGQEDVWVPGWIQDRCASAGRTARSS